jgi:hypothetical protein
MTKWNRIFKRKRVTQGEVCDLLKRLTKVLGELEERREEEKAPEGRLIRDD